MFSLRIGALLVFAGTFVGSAGCGKRQPPPPAPAQSEAQVPADVARQGELPGPDRRAQARNWPASDAPSGAAALRKQAVPAIKNPGARPRGLPEPLGNPKGPGPEPLWRVRARNY